MIFKNIVSLIRRYPAAIAANYIGLVLSFLAFLIICTQVRYETSFDTCYPTAGRIFRADKTDDESLFRNILPRGFSDDIINSSAHIEAGCSLCPFFGDTYFYVKQEGIEPTGYKRAINSVSPEFIKVFGIELVEGSPDALETEGSAIIPESLARLLFPGESAIGKVLHTDAKFLLGSTGNEATITGVYRDLPSNAQLNNDIYASIGHLYEGTYGAANFICYVLLDDASNKGQVEEEFNSHFDFSQFDGWLSPIELVPVEDIYYLNEGNVYKSGTRSQTLLLIALAILILAVGAINFTNFYTALTPVRIRSINTQKIMGASTARLRTGIIAESVLWCITAFILAAAVIVPVSGILYSRDILSVAFSFTDGWPVALFSSAIAILTGIAAGIWPSIFSTSIQPALVIKGGFGFSRTGKTLRTLLIGVQFVISIALFLFVLFVQKQSAFMKSYPCGFDKDRLAVVNIGGDNAMNKSEWLREELTKYADIEEVAYSLELVGSSDIYNTMTYDFGFGPMLMNMIYCSYNFPQALGLVSTQGEMFGEQDYGQVLLTDNLRRQGTEQREYPNFTRIKGFVNDVNISSMRKANACVCFYMCPKDMITMPYAYIRMAEGADRATVFDHISSTLKEMDHVFSHDIQFYSTVSEQLYRGENRVRKVIWIFSCLAVILSLVGIWGQTLMDLQYKRKEIAVKRVMGAGRENIIVEGILKYARTLGICFLVGIPAGYLLVSEYLTRFTERVGISAELFVITIAAVCVLTLCVVLSQYLRAASGNPADTLKTE